MTTLSGIDAQITFLYYDDLGPAASFYQEVLGLELVEDQGWARIYRAGRDAYLGIVSGERGFHRPQQENAVLLTLLVADVPAWYERLKAGGVRLLSELQHRQDIGIRCFFLEDPGGYTLEIQQFLKPEVARIFHVTRP